MQAGSHLSHKPDHHEPQCGEENAHSGVAEGVSSFVSCGQFKQHCLYFLPLPQGGLLVTAYLDRDHHWLCCTRRSACRIQAAKRALLACSYRCWLLSASSYVGLVVSRPATKDTLYAESLNLGANSMPLDR